MTEPIAIAKKPEFKSEKIAYWFFRLNGCLLLENFLVHHERRGREGTEIDILAVRFPHRNELLLTGEAMPDFPAFDSPGKIDIILGEAKTRQKCDINESWLNPERKNVERILYIVGALPPGQVNEVAAKIYSNLHYENSFYRFRLFAIGAETNSDLSKAITQITWADALSFIHERFSVFRKYKTQHRQWDLTGKKLFALTRKLGADKFINYVTTNMQD